MKNDTICWFCKNAYCKCDWSKNFKPVENWVAEKTTIINRYDEKEIHRTESYIVRECPCYVRDSKKTAKEIAKELGISLKTYYRKKLNVKETKKGE